MISSLAPGDTSGNLTNATALPDWSSSRHHPETSRGKRYESHEVMSAELDVDGLAGGALFEWCVSDPQGGFHRRFNSMADWVSRVAELINDGQFLRRETEQQGPWLLVPHPERYDEERATAPPAHPRYGDTLHIDGDILNWPEHWQRANGLRPESLVLRGATHTVADVLASPAAVELRATIAARVVDLAGLGGAARVRVDDGTGRLDVACPVSTTLLGPRMRDWYEFDIVVAPGERKLPADPDVAGEDITDEVERVTAKLMARYGGPATATAQAIRRIPAPHDSTG